MGLFSVIIFSLALTELCRSETVFVQGSRHYQPEKYLIPREL